MYKKKILLVVGNRPQYIKAGIISYYLKKIKTFKVDILDTNQHYDKNLSSLFFKNFKYKPKFNLKIGSHSNEIAISKIIYSFSKFLKKKTYNVIIVLGDTNTTAAVALCARHKNLKLIHIEAGERINHKKDAPEEINRIIADQCSDLLFTCSKVAKINLMNEGHDIKNIKFVGDPMLDIFKLFSKKLINKKRIYNFDYIFATLHRKENTKKEILFKILNLLDNNKLKVILALHPRTSKIIKKYNWKPKKNLIFIKPVDYSTSIKLLLDSSLVFTDSGGIKREAYYAKKKCISPQSGDPLWPDTVRSGWNKTLNPTDLINMKKFLKHFPTPEKPHSLSSFGNGLACKKIIRYLNKII
tara:strand:- start:1965 stop:3032 length:1068 start_codon:yes stop_codon:yes gene_type:complete